MTEQPWARKTILTVTDDFSGYTKDIPATINVYLTATATKPVATATLKVIDMPFNLVFFKTDHLGTPRVITDQDGTVLSIHDYLAYGEELTDPEFTTNRMKFTGHERDPETGLDYMLARYYSAGGTRFLQVDPGYDYDKMDPMSWNLYAYVRGNPIMRTDPDGKFVFVVAIITLAAIDAALFAKVAVDSADKGFEARHKADKGIQKLIDNGTEVGPDGPVNELVQKANKTVAEAGENMAGAALDVVPMTPNGPFFTYPREGADIGNMFSLAKTAYHWVKKGVNWVLEKVGPPPEKKKGLKINSTKDRGKPDRLDKDYEPALNGDGNCLAPSPSGPSPSKRHPKTPLWQKEMHTIS